MPGRPASARQAYCIYYIFRFRQIFASGVANIAQPKSRHFAVRFQSLSVVQQLIHNSVTDTSDRATCTPVTARHLRPVTVSPPPRHSVTRSSRRAAVKAQKCKSPLIEHPKHSALFSFENHPSPERCRPPMMAVGRSGACRFVEHKERQINGGRFNVGHKRHGPIVEDQPPPPSSAATTMWSSPLRLLCTITKRRRSGEMSACRNVKYLASA